jgi:hypothetical protein
MAQRHWAFVYDYLSAMIGVKTISKLAKVKGRKRVDDNIAQTQISEILRKILNPDASVFIRNVA